MSIDTFLPIQAALQGAGFIAAVLAVGYLAAAILGWRGPNRKRRLIRFALFLVAVPICVGIHVAILYGVVIPSLARNADNARQARIDDAAIVHTGDVAPSFTVTKINGDQFNLDDFRGKVVLVNFFATWCGPCLLELPHVQKLWDDNRDNSNFALIAIGRKETKESIIAFQSKHGYTFPLAADSDRTAYSLFAKTLIPRTYLVSRDGKICFSSTGFREKDIEQLESELAKQLRSIQ